MSEHQSERAYGSTDLYEYLRDLEALEIEWHFERLQTVYDNDTRDAEQQHLIRLVREGHELKNMRKGSIISLVKLAKTDPAIAERLATMDLGPAGNKLRDSSGGLASRRLRQNMLKATLEHMLRHKGIPDVAACPEFKALMPVEHGRIARRAAKRGHTVWIAPGDMTLRDLVCSARSAHLWPHVDRI